MKIHYTPLLLIKFTNLFSDDEEFEVLIISVNDPFEEELK